MTASQIFMRAEAKGWFRCIRIDDGSQELELFVADDIDLEGRFDGICALTGDALRVNGWMILSVEG